MFSYYFLYCFVKKKMCFVKFVLNRQMSTPLEHNIKVIQHLKAAADIFDTLQWPHNTCKKQRDNEKTWIQHICIKYDLIDLRVKNDIMTLHQQHLFCNYVRELHNKTVAGKNWVLSAYILQRIMTLWRPTFSTK